MVPTRDLTRRHALTSIAAATGTAAAGTPWYPVLAGPLAATPGVCVLTPQTTAGPFYFDPKLERVDIREEKPGVPVKLSFRVLKYGACTPLAGARVDVWHADATGAYSGYDRQSDRRNQSTTGLTFLRGTQVADAAGLATFTTIYPGWYPGRTPHIHYKVFIDRRTVLTGQSYFPDDVSNSIYAGIAPYNLRAVKRDTSNASDVLLRRGAAEAAFFSVEKGADSYSASLTVAVDLGRDSLQG